MGDENWALENGYSRVVMHVKIPVFPFSMSGKVWEVPLFEGRGSRFVERLKTCRDFVAKIVNL